MQVSKNQFGSVRPYTRHTQSCGHRGEANHNQCDCPKWLYELKRGWPKPKRYTLHTTSWDEAVAKANYQLAGYDPERAELRAQKVKTGLTRKSIHDAWQLWIDRAAREAAAKEKRDGGEAMDGTATQYRTMRNKMERWASKRGIQSIGDVTTLQLETWYSSDDWVKDYAPSTRSVRWGVVRSFFAYMLHCKVISENPCASIHAIKPGKDLVQGPYTVDQLQKILWQIEHGPLPATLNRSEKSVYRERLFAFVLLLLHTGCNVVDAVLFDPDLLRDEWVPSRKETVPVYRYYRQKNGLLAVVPLAAEVASILRSVATVPDCVPGMPFRKRSMPLKSNPHFWSSRIRSILKAAGVTHVSVPRKNNKGEPRLKKANSEMFRHTFAVSQLEAGQRLEELAQMMGHTDTKMIKLHYAPWVHALDVAHIERVMAQRGLKPPAPFLVVKRA